MHRISSTRKALKIRTADMAVHDPKRGQAKPILNAIRGALGMRGVPTWKGYITNRKGTSNKYHYFAVFKVGRKWIAANVNGRIGYSPPASNVRKIGEFESEGDAKEAAEKKMNKKVGAGYKSTKMASLSRKALLARIDRERILFS